MTTDKPSDHRILAGGSLPVAGGLVALDRLLGAGLEVLVGANLGRQLFGAITCRRYAAEWHSPREGLQRITVERPLRLAMPSHGPPPARAPLRAILARGEVAERSMAALLKSAESQDSVGSNPTLSARTDPALMRAGRPPSRQQEFAMPFDCPHVAEIRPVPDGGTVCPSCVETDGTWVNLRQCLVCGQVGCCDSSPNTHARRHNQASGHPLMRSIMPDQDWSWCYVCEL